VTARAAATAATLQNIGSDSHEQLKSGEALTRQCYSSAKRKTRIG
jgi:hypothetical protein